jgi:hypothetical protein
VKELTDAECNAFRRLPGDFNAMVRAIYAAGAEAKRAQIEALTKELDRCKVPHERLGGAAGDFGGKAKP